VPDFLFSSSSWDLLSFLPMLLARFLDVLPMVSCAFRRRAVCRSASLQAGYVFSLRPFLSAGNFSATAVL